MKTPYCTPLPQLCGGENPSMTIKIIETLEGQRNTTQHKSQDCDFWKYMYELLQVGFEPTTFCCQDAVVVL